MKNMEILKGCIMRPAVISVCLLFVTALLLVSFLGSVLTVGAGSAEIPLYECVEIAVLPPNNVQIDLLQRSAFYRSAEHLFEKIDKIDLRTFAAAYVENMTPAWPEEDAAHLQHSWGYPNNLVICVAQCTGLSETKLGANGKCIYLYQLEAQEVLYHNEGMPVESDITAMEISDVCEPLVNIGKEYLIWGYYTKNADGSIELVCPVDRQGRQEKRTDDQGDIHYLASYEFLSNNYIPIVSELTEPLDVFWNTEIGQLWQRVVLPKIEVTEHFTCVIGTDCVESIPAFNFKCCEMSRGESITDEQYESGERVCIVSEELAQLNGWDIGQSITLHVYPSQYPYSGEAAVKYHETYDLYRGFTDEGEWRIVGIYHTSYEDPDNYTIHPNTVIVPNNSLKGDYVMEENETSKFPNLYLSYILPSDGWDAFRVEADSLGYAGWFVYGDGGKAEVLEENERRQTALSEWQSAVEKWGKPLPTSSTVLMAVVIFAFVLSKKKEIGRLYAIETPKRTLFVHFFVQTTIVGAVAFGLALLLSPPILSRVVPTVLRDLADPAYADLLMAGIPEESLSWTPILGKQVLVYTAISAICAAIGAGRRYQFEYHN